MKVSNNIIKLVASLDKSKSRKESGLFKAEGSKCAGDILGYFPLRYLIATCDWIESHQEQASLYRDVLYQAAPAEMKRMSHLSTASDVIAVCEIPQYDDTLPEHGLIMALDTVQDPGNLGTIVRACDWFGVRHIVCSQDTVDIFNPKAVMSTMGALARVKVTYGCLSDILSRYKGAVYGTFLDGETIYKAELSSDGIIVLGNEGNGISDKVAQLCNCRLFIPPYPAGAPTSESLNVGVAAAVVLSEFRRNN